MGSGTAAIATGKSGLDGIPRAAIEGSAFVIPAQEVTMTLPGLFSLVVTLWLRIKEIIQTFLEFLPRGSVTRCFDPSPKIL